MEEEKALRNYVLNHNDIESVWISLGLTQKDYETKAIKSIVNSCLIYGVGLVLAVVRLEDFSPRKIKIALTLFLIYFLLCFTITFVFKPFNMKGLSNQFKRNKIKSVDRALALRKEKLEREKR